MTLNSSKIEIVCSNHEPDKLLVGVLALQGAFAEHQHCLEGLGCRTKQVG